METVYSFSQEYEDVILYHLLRDVKEPIRYIDVGANDPIYLSVTKFFSLRGGSGINIEPQHELIEKLNKDRPNDINLEVGVSDKPGTLKLYGTGTGASFDSEITRERNSREVPIVILADVCNQYVAQQTAIHFLKIDVEGFEKQCLEGMDFKNYRPWIVCMESTKPGTDIPAWEPWENILLSQGYEFLGMNGINRYYVAKETKSRINEFRNVDQLQDMYEIFFASLVSPCQQLSEIYCIKGQNKFFKKTIAGMMIMLVCVICYALIK